ncbi:hypothetical protein [Nocardioides sp.]|uniref:hypothetical protein n=1 Tax=Nocardioides sp. TaxID=35761 RepID=UPI003517FE64
MHGLTAHVVTSLLPLVAGGQDGQAPPDDEVVAGWTGFAVFISLVIAVGVLGWSLGRQLKRAERAKAEGVYGDAPEEKVLPDDGPGTDVPESPEVAEHSRRSGDPGAE